MSSSLPTLTVSGHWRSIGVTYSRQLLESAGMFSPDLHRVDQLEDGDELSFNSEESVMGFTAFLDERRFVDGEEGSVRVRIRFEHQNVTGYYVSD